MRPITLLTVVFTLTTLVACNDDTITPQGNTPAYVLELLEESFNRRGISLLDELLSTDFVFYFNTNDVGDIIGDFTIPPSWGRDDHMEACNNMFNQAYSIDFEVVTAGIEDPEEGATTYVANNVQITITVMIDATNGFIANGFCDFELTNDTSGGYDDWKVSEWYDRTSAGGSAGLLSVREPSSLGVILAQFY